MRVLFFVALLAMLVSVSAQAPAGPACGCIPGYYLSGASCLPCPVNTYRNSFGNSSCTPCPGQQTSTAASSYCSTPVLFTEYPGQGVAGVFTPPTPASLALCGKYLSGDQCVVGTVDNATSLCAADSNCGGVLCQNTDTGCTLRYYPLTPLFAGHYNFYAKDGTTGYWFVPKRNQVLFETAAIPAGTSTALCTQFNAAVNGQCTPPTLAAAQTLCAFDNNCLAINCHNDDTVCTLRYAPLIAGPQPSTAYNVYLKA